MQSIAKILENHVAAGHTPGVAASAATRGGVAFEGAAAAKYIERLGAINSQTKP